MHELKALILKLGTIDAAAAGAIVIGEVLHERSMLCPCMLGFCLSMGSVRKTDGEGRGHAVL